MNTQDAQPACLMVCPIHGVQIALDVCRDAQLADWLMQSIYQHPNRLTPVSAPRLNRLLGAGRGANLSRCSKYVSY